MAAAKPRPQSLVPDLKGQTLGEILLLKMIDDNSDMSLKTSKGNLKGF